MLFNFVAAGVALCALLPWLVLCVEKYNVGGWSFAGCDSMGAGMRGSVAYETKMMSM